MSNINAMEQLAQAVGIPSSDIPPYVRLSAAMERLGFSARLYIDGKFVAETEGLNVKDAMSNLQPPVALFWSRDDGQQVIQCARSDGESVLFWPTTGTDIESQLAYLSERFASPTILGNTGGGIATGRLPGSDETDAGV